MREFFMNCFCCCINNTDVKEDLLQDSQMPANEAQSATPEEEDKAAGFTCFQNIPSTRTVQGGGTAIVDLFSHNYFDPQTGERQLAVVKTSKSPQYDIQFKQELKIMRQLQIGQRNPYIITCLGYEKPPSEDLPVTRIIFEHADLGDLFEFFNLNSQLYNNTPFMRQTAHQIISGIAFFHQKHVIHRDLKCENILVFQMPDGTIRMKIGDFGSATVLDQDGTTAQDRELSSTPEFLAPEAFQAPTHGKPLDIYAFGIIVWLLATGNREPYPKHAYHAKNGRYSLYNHPYYLAACRGERPRMWRVKRSRALRKHAGRVQQMLHQNPAKRPTADELVKAFSL